MNVLNNRTRSSSDTQPLTTATVASHGTHATTKPAAKTVGEHSQNPKPPSMNHKYESTLAKARKLAAILDPKANASEGERRNAATMLDGLCAKHGINLATLLANADKQTRELECRAYSTLGDPEPLTAKADMDFAALALACLRKITNNADHDFKLFERKIPYGKRGKAHKLILIRAEVTAVEFDDWRECFLHYSPILARAQRKAKAEIEQAAKMVREKKKVLAMVAKAVLNEYDIFADDTPVNAASLSPEDIAYWAAAAKGISGQEWQKKAGHLQSSHLHLE